MNTNMFSVNNMYTFFNKPYIEKEKSMSFKNWIKFMVYRITGYLVYKTSTTLNMIVLTSFVDSAWENSFDGVIEIPLKRIFFKFLMLCKDKENDTTISNDRSHTSSTDINTDNDGNNTGDNHSVSRGFFSNVNNTSSSSNDFESGQFIIGQDVSGVILDNLHSLLKVYNKEACFPTKTYFAVIVEGDYFFENKQEYEKYNIKTTFIGNTNDFSKWWNKIIYGSK